MPRGRPRLNISDEERAIRMQESRRRYEENHFAYRRLAKNFNMQTESAKAQRRIRYAINREAARLAKIQEDTLDDSRSGASSEEAPKSI